MRMIIIIIHHDREDIENFKHGGDPRKYLGL